MGKSNASSEVEYRAAWGTLLGEPGRGVRTIVEMVVHTRLDCIIGSSALMRLCALHAANHARGRGAFGQPLVDQPLMRNVLADLAIESEAALAMWLRLARAFDHNKTEAAFTRMATAVSKYYICKRAPMVAFEAMECHGGNGYVEDWPMAKLYRQAPLNAIWEGSGNVICLDVIRALIREPESATALLGELSSAVEAAQATQASCGLSNAYGQTVAWLRAQLVRPPTQLEATARTLVDMLAVCLQAATLLKYGHPDVAQAFLVTRLPAVDANLADDRTLHIPSHNLGAMSSRLPLNMIETLIQRLGGVSGTSSRL